MKKSQVLGFCLLLGIWSCTTKPRPVGKPISELQKNSANQDKAKQDNALQEKQDDKAALEKIYFDYDRTNIRPDAIRILEKNAKVLRFNPALRIQIEGHCDERGTVEYNLSLGHKRANAVRQYLIDLGIAPNRLVTVSYGKERPAALGYNESAWSKNRRAEFVVIAQ